MHNLSFYTFSCSSKDYSLDCLRVTCPIHRTCASLLMLCQLAQPPYVLWAPSPYYRLFSLLSSQQQCIAGAPWPLTRLPVKFLPSDAASSPQIHTVWVNLLPHPAFTPSSYTLSFCYYSNRYWQRLALCGKDFVDGEQAKLHIGRLGRLSPAPESWQYLVPRWAMITNSSGLPAKVSLLDLPCPVFFRDCCWYLLI